MDPGGYFSIFAPRQSGKTTFLEQLRSRLHDDPAYVVVTLGFQDFKKLVDKSRFYSLLQKYLYEQLLNRLEQVDCEKNEGEKISPGTFFFFLVGKSDWSYQAMGH